MLAEWELPQKMAAICSANLGSQLQGAIFPKHAPCLTALHGLFVRVLIMLFYNQSFLMDFYNMLTDN
jgi:hypothetical protein